MGLPNERVDGIRMAAVIHDIGKLSVPVELLSMPRTLTDIEFNLVKLVAAHCPTVARIDLLSSSGKTGASCPRCGPGCR